MLSKAVIPLQPTMGVFKERYQNPEKQSCIQQRNQITPCEDSSPLPYVINTCSKGQQILLKANSTLDW